MRIWRRHARTVVVAGLVLAGAGAAAQEGGPEPETERVGNCIRVGDIRRSRVLDDSSVLFDLAGGRRVLMRLKYPCPQLAFHGYFSYQATLGQLCTELDHIVTRAGNHCPIGDFSIWRGGIPDRTGEERAPAR